MMYYKQLAGDMIIAIGTTIEGTALPFGFAEISKKEYDTLLKIFSMEPSGTTNTIKTPINEKGEII